MRHKLNITDNDHENIPYMLSKKLREELAFLLAEHVHELVDLRPSGVGL